MMKGVDLADLDMVKISQILWAFLGGHALHNKVYERRLQLTGGEEGNGLELWRALYHENQGGAEHVIMGASEGSFGFRDAPTNPSFRAGWANGRA